VSLLAVLNFFSIFIHAVTDSAGVLHFSPVTGIAVIPVYHFLAICRRTEATHRVLFRRVPVRQWSVSAWQPTAISYHIL